MDIQTFEIFAEVSIAVFGFSGITAAIGGQSQSPDFLTARVKGLLFAAGIASASSIAPLTTIDLAYCALAYVLFTTLFLIWSVTGLLKNPAAQPSKVIFVIGCSFTISTIGALLYSLLKEPEILQYAYIYSVCVTLALAGLFFIRLVLAITSGKGGN